MMTVETVDHLPMKTMITLVALQVPTVVLLAHLYDLALALQTADVTMILRQEGSSAVVVLNSIVVAVAALFGTVGCLRPSVCGPGRTSPMTSLMMEEQRTGLLVILSTERDTAVRVHEPTEGQDPNVSAPARHPIVMSRRNAQTRRPTTAQPAWQPCHLMRPRCLLNGKNDLQLCWRRRRQSLQPKSVRGQSPGGWEILSVMNRRKSLVDRADWRNESGEEEVAWWLITIDVPRRAVPYSLITHVNLVPISYVIQVLLGMPVTIYILHTTSQK
jgi:hypothetical protein